MTDGRPGHGVIVERRVALFVVENDRYSSFPRWLQRWAFRRTTVRDRARSNMRKHAGIIERLGR